MENGRNYYSTYRFYDGQNRRLAIFGEEQPDNKLKVTIITCSKKDQYSKKAVEAAFKTGYISKFKTERYWDEVDKTFKFRILETKIEIHPIVFTIPIGDNKPKFSLIKYCKENFWQIDYKTVEIEVPYLFKLEKKEETLDDKLLNED